MLFLLPILVLFLITIFISILMANLDYVSDMLVILILINFLGILEFETQFEIERLFEIALDDTELVDLPADLGIGRALVGEPRHRVLAREVRREAPLAHRGRPAGQAVTLSELLDCEVVLALGEGRPVRP